MLDPLIHRHFFCADLSRYVHESMYGTGVVASVYVLLEYPGGWESRAIMDSTLSPEVKAYLGELAKGPLRAKTLLIKQDRHPIDRITMFAVLVSELEPVSYEFKLDSYEDILNLDLTGFLRGQIPAGAMKLKHPLFLVCTHGRHDKCCAKFGYPTYKLMRTYYREGTWQVSHVGGDRFASNVVCFPHGIYYGHVDHDDAIGIIDGYRAGRLRVKNYRGRSCYTKEGQVAEYFLRSETGIMELDRVRLLDVVQSENEETYSATFLVDGTERHVVRYSRRASEFQNFMTCHAASRKSVSQYSLIDVVQPAQ
jgi:hypothetical protein